MGDRDPAYDDNRPHESSWARRERLREEQELRLVAIRVADCLLETGRWFARRGGRDIRKARGPLFTATLWYDMAGMSWRSRIAARLGQLVHRYEFKCAGMPPVRPRPPHRRASLPPTRRWVELAAAVERLTAELGHPPGWTLLARELGIGASTVRELARRARDGGVVTFTEGQPRSIRVVRRPGHGTEGT